jgi:hypothetical protein
MTRLHRRGFAASLLVSFFTGHYALGQQAVPRDDVQPQNEPPLSDAAGVDELKAYITKFQDQVVKDMLDLVKELAADEDYKRISDEVKSPTVKNKYAFIKMALKSVIKERNAQEGTVPAPLSTKPPPPAL